MSEHGLSKELFVPWLKGHVPKSYEHVVNTIEELMAAAETVTAEDIVAAGGAAIGSPETLVASFSRLADAGVDEVLMYMSPSTRRTTRSCDRSSSSPTKSCPRSMTRPAAASPRWEVS